MSISDDSIIKSVIFFLDDFVGKGRMKQPFYSLSCQWAMVAMRACLSKFKIYFIYYYAQYFFISLFFPVLMFIICIPVTQVKYVFKS